MSTSIGSPVDTSVNTPASADAARPVPAAPRGRPGVAVIAIVLALGLIALAAVAVRDLAVARGWSSGEPWIPAAVRDLDGLTATTGVLVVGGVAAVVGLLFVLAALRPAPRTHLMADDAGLLWVSPRALAEVAEAAADRTPGVVTADARRSGRRRIAVDVTTAGDLDAVRTLVEVAVADRLAGLTTLPVVVRAKEVAAS
mgnify:CR=1 FL=1